VLPTPPHPRSSFSSSTSKHVVVDDVFDCVDVGVVLVGVTIFVVVIHDDNDVIVIISYFTDLHALGLAGGEAAADYIMLYYIISYYIIIHHIIFI
jgi:hypothetical protein